MMSAALRPSSRVLAPLVESRFPNRPLYTTSFEVGADGAMEWVIWFAEQTTRNEQYATVRPPVPWARVETAPDVALPPGRFAAAAVIDKGGQASSVIVLSGGDAAAKEAAAKLIGQWVFLPALRNGEPIAVDTLIEISFRRRP
jgi:Gram-negative bacterial TonB protein C-terminal